MISCWGWDGASSRILPTAKRGLTPNAEVLGTIEATCLSPAAVERIVEGALAALTRPPEATAAREAALRGELAALEGEIARYTAAVGQAPDLASVLDALRMRERQRTTLRAELDGMRRLREAGPIDRRLVERRVRAVVADWRGLMGRQVSESRRLLKGFLEGRVVFTPQPQRDVVDFVGRCGWAGCWPERSLPLSVVSPTGFKPVLPAFRCHFVATEGGESGAFRGFLRRRILSRSPRKEADSQ